LSNSLIISTEQRPFLGYSIIAKQMRMMTEHG
jgi:hypothetical protein